MITSKILYDITGNEPKKIIWYKWEYTKEVMDFIKSKVPGIKFIETDKWGIKYQIGNCSRFANKGDWFYLQNSLPQNSLPGVCIVNPDDCEWVSESKKDNDGKEYVFFRCSCCGAKKKRIINKK